MEKLAEHKMSCKQNVSLVGPSGTEQRKRDEGKGTSVYTAGKAIRSAFGVLPAESVTAIGNSF